jgi:4-hydroxy-4-methyl-2-oxoglutarate aldolase
MNHEEILALFERLKQFDTPTVTNVVATYPKKKEECLGLYDPWAINWYTDQDIKCIYPELGRRVGFAVTCVYGLPNPNFDRLDFSDVLKALEDSPQPTILVIKQDFPEHIRKKNGLLGGNMCTAMKRAGCVGCITDGPSRDIDEVRQLEFQLMLTGISPGHGEFAVKAVNVPVSVCSMDVAPGEIIHMDENGACKFPASKLKEVVELCEKLAEKESKQMEIMRNAENINQVGKIMKGYGV